MCWRTRDALVFWHERRGGTTLFGGLATVTDALFRNLDDLNFQAQGEKPLEDLNDVLEYYRQLATELDSVLYIVDSATMPDDASEITIRQKAGALELKDAKVNFYVLTPQDEAACPLWQGEMAAKECRGWPEGSAGLLEHLRKFLGMPSPSA